MSLCVPVTGEVHWDFSSQEHKIKEFFSIITSIALQQGKASTVIRRVIFECTHSQFRGFLRSPEALGFSLYSMFIVLPELHHWQIGHASLAITLKITPAVLVRYHCQFIFAIMDRYHEEFHWPLIMAISLGNSKTSQDSLICYLFYRSSWNSQEICF